MNYLYLGLGDLYLPAVASALHLGMLSSNKRPEYQELDALPYFTRGESVDDGKLFLLGKDQAGNSVYILCVKDSPDVVERAIQSLLHIYGITEMIVLTCRPENSQVVKLGRILKRLGLLGIERRLAFKLAVNNFPELIKLTTQVQNNGKNEKKKTVLAAASK
jgi:hypothetical protein